MDIGVELDRCQGVSVVKHIGNPVSRHLMHLPARVLFSPLVCKCLSSATSADSFPHRYPDQSEASPKVPGVLLLARETTRGLMRHRNPFLQSR